MTSQRGPQGRRENQRRLCFDAINRVYHLEMELGSVRHGDRSRQLTARKKKIRSRRFETYSRLRGRVAEERAPLTIQHWRTRLKITRRAAHSFFSSLASGRIVIWPYFLESILTGGRDSRISIQFRKLISQMRSNSR